MGSTHSHFPNGPQLANFPSEVLEQLLTFAEPNDLLAISMVSHRFAKIAASDEVWNTAIVRVLPAFHYDAASLKIPLKTLYLKQFRSQLFYEPRCNKENTLAIFKISIMGSMGQGKGSLMRRIKSNKWLDGASSLGMDMEIMNIEIQNKPVRFLLARHEPGMKFDTTRQTMRGAHCMLICLDVSDIGNFDTEFGYWVRMVEGEFQENRDGVVIAVIGTKADRRKDPAMHNCVPLQHIHDLCAKQNWMYFEVSSKTGSGVHESFQFLTHVVFYRYLAHKPPSSTTPTAQKDRCITM